MPKSKNADIRIKVLYSTAEMMKLCNKELEDREFATITALNSIQG